MSNIFFTDDDFDTKRKLSFTLLKLSSDEQKLIDYIKGKTDKSVAMEFGKVLHQRVAKETVKPNIGEKDEIIDDKVFLSPETLSKTILMKLIVEQDKFIVDADDKDIKHEIRVIMPVTFEGMKLKFKCLIDMVNLKQRIMIEMKTTAVLINDWYTKKTIFKYCYHMQAYLYYIACLYQYQTSLSPAFLFIEKEAPFKTSGFYIDSFILNAGKVELIKHLKQTIALLKKNDLLYLFLESKT